MLYKHPSLWSLDKWYVIGAVLLCGAAGLLIIGLWRQRRRRRLAEQLLAERLRFEALVADVSANLVKLTPDTLDQGIVCGLQRIAEFFGADRGNLVQFSEQSEKFRVTHSWAATGVAPLPANMTTVQFPWEAEHIHHGHIVYFSRLDELPPKAIVDRQLYQQYGTKSKIVIPLNVNERPLGAIAISAVHMEHTWPEELVHGCRLLGEIFAAALLRCRAEMEMQRYREELAHVARVTMLGELAASIAHEITHPLFAMTTNADACRRWLADGIIHRQRMLEALEDIVKDGNRASAVMQRIRAFLNREALQLTLLDINSTIHEIIALVRSELLSKQVTLQLDLSDDLPPVHGDSVQLQQVLLNLIRNAEDAMTEVAAEDRTIVVRTTRAQADTVQVAVQDCGSGLREATAERLFAPFYTTKPGGMGMGLAICRSIIETHGGRLWAANNLEGGATFYFALPVREERS